MQQRTPIEIKRTGESGVTIRWSDGTTHTIPSSVLRPRCPCATCREAQGDTSHARPLTTAPPKKKSLLKIVEHTLDEQLKLTQIWGIGNYALGMEWGDGHNSGIYPYQYLFEIGEIAAHGAVELAQ